MRGPLATTSTCYMPPMGARSPSSPKQPPALRPKKPTPRDVACRVKTGRGAEVRKGSAILTDDAIRFHTGRTGRNGIDFSLQVSFDEITALVVDETAGTLVVSTSEDAKITFYLGQHAAAWKGMIQERPDSLAVLAIEPRSRVAVVGVGDAAFVTELEESFPGCTQVADDAAELDVIFIGLEHRADLARLATQTLRVRRPGGVLWAVYPASSRVIAPHEIVPAARTAGLFMGDTVVVSKSHQALRLTRF
jgi:hypothetical protein